MTNYPDYYVTTGYVRSEGLRPVYMVVARTPHHHRIVERFTSRQEMLEYAGSIMDGLAGFH